MCKITTPLTSLRFALLDAGPVHADKTNMVPPKKPAASTPKPNSTQAKGAQSAPYGHCVQSGGHMHKGMKGQMKGGVGMNGMRCSEKAGKMRPMGTAKPDMPMSDHDI